MFGLFFYLAHNAISLSMIWFTVNRCLKPRYSRAKTILVEAICLAIALLLGFFREWYPELLTAGCSIYIAVSFFSLALILFQNKVFFRLLVMLCAYFTVVATELLTYICVPNQSLNMVLRDFSAINLWWNIFYLSCEGILLYCVYVIFHNKSTGEAGQIPARQYWFFLFFPFSQLALLTITMYTIAPYLSVRTAVITFCCFAVCAVADYVWFLEIRRLSENARLKAENDLLGKQIETQRSYYQTLSDNYADMARMRHDISNHIFTIRALLQDGNPDEAMQYAEQLESSPVAKSILSSCKNSVVHSFLRHRWKELQEKGIAASFQVVLAPASGISDTDLIIALGNMLDNAAEASLTAEKPEITLSVREVDRYVHIEVINTCTISKTPKKRRIAYLERGIGTSILQSLAEQHQGSYTSTKDGGKNHAVMVMKQTQEH